MTITSLFKDKNKNGRSTSDASVASVTHATVEVDRGGLSADLNGLSPAARLARQHTLKSNEEARKKAEEEAKARERLATEDSSNVPAWERGTTNRKGQKLGVYDEDEEGFVHAEVDSGSDDDSEDGTFNGHQRTWGIDEEEEDITIRVNQRLGVTHDVQEDEGEAWAINVRRSIERTKTPAKGILKSGCSILLFPSLY